MAEPIIELELYLVRHGESRSNVGLGDAADVRAWEDPMLSEKGEIQARLLGEYYARVDFDCILASGMNRALQTAGAVALRQARTRTVEAHPIFSEGGIPTAVGIKPFDEIRAAFPFAVPAAGTETETNFIFAEDNSTDAMRYARAERAITYLRRRFHGGERVLLAAHANFNTFLVFAALGLGYETAFDFANANTGVSKFVFYAPGTGLWGADTHLIYHNDRSHLAAVYPEDLLTKL